MICSRFFILTLSVVLLASCASSTTAPSPQPVSIVATQPVPAVTQNVSAVSDPPAVQAAVTPDSPQPFDLERADVRKFIEEVSARNKLPIESVRALLGQGMHQPKIIVAMTRPAETVLTWDAYRARLVSAERIARGGEFWQTHRERLERTAADTGVDPAIIVAIIGIETNYGRNKGSWRVLDALMTLGFDYPRRGEFFRSELEHFILMTREESLDPTQVLGSYAGAMGAPQFMPSSYRRFAVNGPLDGQSDARRDLFNDWDDVIASVANYFVVHGWRPSEPVLLETTVVPSELAASLDRRNLELNQTLAGLRALGVGFDTALKPETRAMLVPAETTMGPGARVGLHNFRVITRYNRSVLYAMAVNDLATALRRPTELSAK